MPLFKNRFMAQSIAERREMILHGNTLRTLLILSLPTLLMAFVQSLIPLSDGLFLNRSGGVIVASSVGYCQPIINMINAVSMGIAVAATAIIGQLNGRGDMEQVRHVSSQMMIFGFILGIILAPITIVLAYYLSTIVKAELAASVFTYLSMYAMVFPLLFLAAIFNAIKNATGQPEATLYRMIILLICKLIFNAIFLSALSMGVAGAVLASLCSYIIIAIWMYYDLYVRKSETQLTLRAYRPDRAVIRQLLRIGLPSMLSSTMINFGFFLINMEVEAYGPAVLNAQTIASNLNALSFTLPSAVSTTVTTMVSMNIAIHQKETARKVVKQAIGVALVIALIIIAIFIPCAAFFVSLFTDIRQISEISVYALNIYTFSIIGFAVFMVVQGAYVGLGRTKITLVAGVLRIWLFRYCFILVAKAYFHMGVESVFWGNLFSNFLAAIIFAALLLLGPFESVIHLEEQSAVISDEKSNTNSK